MANGNDNDERELRWMETPKGRAIINAVSLTVFGKCFINFTCDYIPLHFSVLNIKCLLKFQLKLGELY